jgi:glucosyl-dolichyl phosphate glucuronosyltransferase
MASWGVSVIICAYAQERWEELSGAVQSVQAQSRRVDELVVVVDHNDSLRRRVRDAFPEITVVANSGRRGLSGARNSGVAASSGDIVAFLDDDAVAASDWLDWLLRAYEEPDVMGVGGAIEPLWESTRPWMLPPEFDWVVGCSYRGMPEHTASVRNLIGANMSFRRDILDRVGSFQPGIGRVGTRPVGCEETDLCIRALQLVPTGTFIYEPRAKVGHHVPRSRTQWSYFRSRCYAEGLSKAVVARRVGTRDGLASERAYTLRQLPRAVARELVSGVTGDAAGFLRATSVLLGLCLTTLGFAVGSLRAGEATAP